MAPGETNYFNFNYFHFKCCNFFDFNFFDFNFNFKYRIAVGQATEEAIR